MERNTFFTKKEVGRIYVQIALVMLLGFVASSGQFLATLHLGVMIDDVEKGSTETLYHFYVIVVSLSIYIAGSGVFTFLGGKLTAKVSCRMRIEMGMKICSARYQALEQMEDGELLTMITRDIESIKDWFSIVLKFGSFPICFVLTPYFLFRWCNWKFSLFVLCLIPLNAVPSVWLSKKLPVFYGKEKKAYGKVLSFFTATLRFVTVIKTFGLEESFITRNKSELENYKLARKRRVLYEKLAEEYNRTYGHISRILILLLGAYFIFAGEMTLGRLTSIILLADFVGDGLKILGNIPMSIQNKKVSISRIEKLLCLPDEVEEPVGIGKSGVELPDTKQVFEIRGLRFLYGNMPVLHNINFCVKEGEKIAVVGPSGCGKTTLFKLLSGLYTPEKGQIYFRGIDSAELSSAYLRNHITVTTQDAFLFQATLEENIKVAKPDGNKAEVLATCRNAQTDAFVQTFPRGYDTPINTTVPCMSNGQMQRINLARAFLKNTDIFLLDEPMSALDSQTAGVVWDFLFSECVKKTMLIILHDLEEVNRFHKILVMNQGEVAGFGTHDELMQSCRSYQMLYNEKEANNKRRAKNADITLHE